ncbi:PH domain-containing protein, partial [Geodermatophilus sp. SYSU D00710]
MPGEQVHLAFKTVRDFVAFTSKRLIAVNVQGFSGEKRDSTSLPYSQIQAFSVETAGTFDLDAGLDLWFSGTQSTTAPAPRGRLRRLDQVTATQVVRAESCSAHTCVQST